MNMNVKEYLAQGKPLLFDGGMGTYFSAQPGREDQRCELANLDDAEAILSIHRQYLDAGCQAIQTNTFAVSRILAQGDTALAQAIVERACALAQEAAAPYGAYVFADLGPVPALPGAQPD